MKVGQIGPTFIFPVKTVTFYWVESLVTSSILKMRKSHKKLAPVYAYPHAYTQIRDRGGWLGPPPPWIGLKEIKASNNIWPFHVLDLYCTISCTRSNVRHCKRNVFHIVWWASQLGGVEVIEAYLSSDMQVTSIWHSFWISGFFWNVLQIKLHLWLWWHTLGR